MIRRSAAVAAALGVILAAQGARADPPAAAAPGANQTPAGQGAQPTAAAPQNAPSDDPLSDYFANWFKRVDEAQASQPSWITPLETVTPRLEEEFRFDYMNESLGNGSSLNVYDGGKGLELIPTTTNEILINLPPYQTRSAKNPVSGFNDWQFLTIKQRFISANAQNGDYIVTGFLGVQAPTGVAKFTNDAWIVTPTLAAGKGWGAFDIQATVGVPVPLAHEGAIGTSLVSNTTFQYHLWRYFWPEFEVNLTHWFDGLRADKTQVFLTPGVVIGRFPLVGRSKLIAGIGYQFAVSPALLLTPALTPLYQHSFVGSLRVTF